MIKATMKDKMGGDKECRGCLEVLPLSSFPTRKDRSGRLRPYCKECLNSAQKSRYEHHKRTNPFKHRCSRARTRAKFLGVDFDLTAKDLEVIWTGVCPVFGTELNLNTDRKDENAAELDRFYPEVGYVKGNVNWISRRANRLKNNVTQEELKKLLEWMEHVESN